MVRRDGRERSEAEVLGLGKHAEVKAMPEMGLVV